VPSPTRHLSAAILKIADIVNGIEVNDAGVADVPIRAAEGVVASDQNVRSRTVVRLRDRR
jgi:hypothetical protein